MKTLLIANPAADSGRAAAAIPQTTQTLEQLGIPFDLKETSAPGEATEYALIAAQQGYERVVALGGDGTCNEVANGLMLAREQGYTPAMGLIPSGSGNDFAYALNISLDQRVACQRLRDGGLRMIDVGRVMVDGHTQFFVNNVGLGLDAATNLQARRTKFLTGQAQYLWSALLVVLTGEWPYSAKISIADQVYEEQITLLTVGNGPRVGGGFFLTPQAKLDDGLFDICFAGGVSRLNALKLLPKTRDGSHVSHPVVTLTQATHLEIVVDQGIPAHSDGEILCERGQHFQFDLLPGVLPLWI